MHTLRSTNLNKIVIKALLHFRFKANEYKFAGIIIMPQSKGIFKK